MCVYIDIYIYAHIETLESGLLRTAHPIPSLRGHCLSNAACLIRPHVFYACFVVSRIPIVCYIVRPF